MNKEQYKEYLRKLLNEISDLAPGNENVPEANEHPVARAIHDSLGISSEEDGEEIKKTADHYEERLQHHQQRHPTDSSEAHLSNAIEDTIHSPLHRGTVTELFKDLSHKPLDPYYTKEPYIHPLAISPPDDPAEAAFEAFSDDLVSHIRDRVGDVKSSQRGTFSGIDRFDPPDQDTYPDDR